MIRFTLNGRAVEVADVDPCTTLLAYLRGRGLTGTKEGCAEGECGACAVALVRAGPDGRTRYEPVNSCLMLLASVDGQEVVTVEGIASDGPLHPVQQAMVEQGGSQCGYCTPGFVVSLFAEYYRPGRGDADPESIAGNLCRCTGYRPIRDVAASMGPPADDAHRERLAQPAPEMTSVRHAGGGRRFYRPGSLAEALAVLRDEPGARVIAGGTDLMVEANLRDTRWPALVSVEGVPELRTFGVGDDALTIGTALSLSEVEERLGDELPVLSSLFPLFSSRLIRNRATLGGNLANASPIGDSPPVLLALDAEVRIAGPSGERTVPLDGFFTAYRKTLLAPGELLVAVRVPKPYPRHARFYKVSKRVHDDISTVAAGFAVDLGDDGSVARARLAFGGVAPTPVRARDAEAALTGRRWDLSAVEAAQRVLASTLKPISDHRGSADYRRAMAGSLLLRFLHETTGADS